MGRVIRVNFSTFKKNEEIKYEKKLIRIRDEIENYLELSCLYEEDSLAVALAAGRFASMKLAQLTGEVDTKNFVNECIKTTLNN